LSIGGAAFAGLILVAGLVLCRPWCHFFCPFGLLGWLLERLAILKIRIDRKACDGCGLCAEACPSSAMATILQDRRTVPDCFACASCIAACPKGAVSLRAWQRNPRPAPGLARPASEEKPSP
jgi:polyferredoxin